MTSGQFTSFPVDKIWVNRETRQRKELVRIPELAKSIADNGLIHPPVIQRDGKLIVGERRWTAIKSLGWTHMPVQFVDELDEIELHAIEYEENVGRVDLPWQEQCLAVERYHQLRASQNPNWTSDNTAEALGMSNSVVSEYRAVAQEIDGGNKRVADAPKLSTAREIVRRDTARKKASAIADVVATILPETKITERKAPLINTDFHEWATAYTGTPFNFIHCDFPYGVGMHKSDQGAGANFGTYADSPDVYWKLLNTLELAMTNVIADSAHLMFWFSMEYYSETKALLSQMGWKVNTHPLVWVKSDNTGIMPDASRQPRRIYETAFIASRGDRLLVSSVSNAFSHPGREKSIHMNEKPVPMLKHFMRMFVDSYSRVLDPTCGSGNALKVAQLLGAPTVLGIEQNEEFFNRAKEAYFNDDDGTL